MYLRIKKKNVKNVQLLANCKLSQIAQLNFLIPCYAHSQYNTHLLHIL